MLIENIPVWKYIKIDSFKILVPEIKNFHRKATGKNSKGNPVDFTSEEKKLVNAALKQIPGSDNWTYIKADPFFAAFLPHIKNYKLKILGRNTRGNALDFSEKEMKEIDNAIRSFIKSSKIE